MKRLINYSLAKCQFKTPQALEELGKTIGKSEQSATALKHIEDVEAMMQKLSRRQVKELPLDFLDSNLDFLTFLMNLSHPESLRASTTFSYILPELRKMLLLEKENALKLLTFYKAYYAKLSHGSFSHQAFAKAMNEVGLYQENPEQYILDYHLKFLTSLYNNNFLLDANLKKLKEKIDQAKPAKTIQDHIELIADIIDKIIGSSDEESSDEEGSPPGL